MEIGGGKGRNATRDGASLSAVGKAGAGAPLRDPSPRCSASVSAESVRQMEKREQDLLEEQPPRGRCA